MVKTNTLFTSLKVNLDPKLGHLYLRFFLKIIKNLNLISKPAYDNIYYETHKKLYGF